MRFSVARVLEVGTGVLAKLGGLAGAVVAVTTAGKSVQAAVPVAAETMHHTTAIFAGAAGAEIISGIAHAVNTRAQINSRRLELARVQGAAQATTAAAQQYQHQASAPFLTPSDGMSSTRNQKVERGVSISGMVGAATLVGAGFYEIAANPITGGNLILAGCALAVASTLGLNHSYDRELGDVAEAERASYSAPQARV